MVHCLSKTADKSLSSLHVIEIGLIPEALGSRKEEAPCESRGYGTKSEEESSCNM